MPEPVTVQDCTLMTSKRRVSGAVALRRRFRQRTVRAVDNGCTLEGFLMSLSESTRAVYRRDLHLFGVFMRCHPEQAASQYLLSDREKLLAQWMETMRVHGLADSTVKRRASTLRSYARWCKQRRA